MPAEAGVSVTVKSAKGDLHTLRGDHWNDFVLNARSMLGEDEGDQLVQSVANVFRAAITNVAPKPTTTAVPADPPDEAQAVSNVVQAFPGTSTVGQPLPQPQAAAPQAAPGEPQPGELRVVNGEQKKWVPPGISKAGKPYKGFWGRP